MKAKNKWSLLFLGLIIVFSVHAASPASKAYLDSKMAVIQAQINAIHLRLQNN